MSQEKTNIKGIENGRANFAWEKVAEIKKEGYAKEYKSYCQKIPMMIKTNGLGATLAFVKSSANKKKDSNLKLAYKVIYDHLTEWLKKKPYLIKMEDEDLLKVVLTLPSQEYRSITVEVFALFSWLRRLAEGQIEGEAESN